MRGGRFDGQPPAAVGLDHEQANVQRDGLCYQCIYMARRDAAHAPLHRRPHQQALAVGIQCLGNGRLGEYRAGHRHQSGRVGGLMVAKMGGGRRHHPHTLRCGFRHQPEQQAALTATTHQRHHVR